MNSILNIARSLLLALLVTVGSPRWASAQNHYRNLVMEGGGVRGIAYIGAFEVLDSMGIIAHLERVAGSSAGAIQATLIAVGYTPKELKYRLMETSFKKLNDGSVLAVPGAVRLSKEMGWYKGEALTAWMEDLIEFKTGNRNLTFGELAAKREYFGNKLLYITGTDLTRQRLLVFSHETFPEMRIADAVRISASIPFYFKPVWMDEKGKTYAMPDSTKNLSMMVDGGLLSNYPLSIFDSTKYISPDLPNTHVRNKETLGLQLEEPERMEDPNRYTQPKISIENNSDYVKALYMLWVDKSNYDLERTISISNRGVSPRVRRLPEKTVLELVESGREGARKFIADNAQWMASRPLQGY